MPLTEDQAVERFKDLQKFQVAEREKLDRIRLYWKGKQRLPAVVPRSAPREVREMARIARVNVCRTVVDSFAQSLFVDGIRAGREAENASVWDVWQENRFDREQAGVNRAGLAYGTSYIGVLPGSPVPVMRGHSPRRLTAVYGDDPDWPRFALERRGAGSYRLYDASAVYEIEDNDGYAVVSTAEHRMGVCPVVRFRDEVDLDAEDDVQTDTDEIVAGQVAPLMDLQDQIDLTSFNLLVAQHYSAFRQRYAIGWLAKEEEKLLSAASQLWTFDTPPDEMKLGEFEQTNLDGYIKSREAALKYAATLSQTPVHELIGEIVNLSAEALAAAEAGKDRKVDERKAGFGESYEQVFWLVGKLTGTPVPEGAEVRWRDTSARAFGALVDGLGKLASLLGIPAEALWEELPFATDQKIEYWKTLKAEGDVFGQLQAELARQGADDAAEVA